MSKVEGNIEEKPAGEEVESERDPLELGEGETDLLTLPVKTEPGDEPAIRHVPIETVTVTSKPDADIEILKDNETANKDTNGDSEKVENETEAQTHFNQPIEAKDSKLAIIETADKFSTGECQKKIPDQPVSMDVDDNDNIDKIKLETNGIEGSKETNSKLNGAETPESYEKLNGDAKEPLRKRSLDTIESELPSKKLFTEVQKTFPNHDNMINDYIQNTTKNNVDEIQQHTEQLLSEIHTLRELAQKKEQEWNNILHLKKVKEEILLRLLRRKQVLSFEKSPVVNGTDRSTETVDLTPQTKNFIIDKSDEISGVAIKQPGSTASTVGSTASVATQSSPLPTPPPAHSLPPHYNPLPPPPPYEKPSPVNILPKPIFPHHLTGMRGPSMPMFGLDLNEQFMARYNNQMGRQGPVKDVKSIIADYRQRHPETVPRRGRRMKTMMNHAPGNSRGSSGKMDSLNNLGMLLNNMDVNQKSMLERLTQVQSANLPNGVSFKDFLVQFANMQQHNTVGLQNVRPQLESILTQGQRSQDPVTVTKAEKESRLQNDRAHSEPHKPTEQRATNPPPYPEISLHPVVSSSNSDQPQQSSSLLHGILTKQASSSTQTISPTLAKLLTSPEKQLAATSYIQAKNCGEITITPVHPKHKESPAAAPSESAPEQAVQLEDEESRCDSEGSGEAGGSGGEGGSRLVIDESAGGSEVPVCQGCRSKDAQFVCAGCANQWYCSRDCQVAAWDEHSEMCSG